MADNILKSLKDIIRLSGLDPSEFVGDWDINMRGVQTWLNTGDLESVELEIYDPKTDALIFRWDINISYGWSGGDGNFWTDTEQLKYAIRKAGLVPSQARYRFLVHTKQGRPDVIGWSRPTLTTTRIIGSLASTLYRLSTRMTTSRFLTTNSASG